MCWTIVISSIATCYFHVFIPAALQKYRPSLLGAVQTQGRKTPLPPELTIQAAQKSTQPVTPGCAKGRERERCRAVRQVQSQHVSTSPALALCCLSPRLSLFSSSVLHGSRKVAPEGRYQAFAQRAASNVQA